MEQPGRCSRRLFPRASDLACVDTPLPLSVPPPHPQLAAAETVLSSPLPRSVVRDHSTPSTRLDEVCLRNGKCGDKTNWRPLSRLLSTLGCRLSRLSRKRWRGDDPCASRREHLRTVNRVRPCFLAATGACTPRARHPSTRRSSAMARHGETARASIPPVGRRS